MPCSRRRVEEELVFCPYLLGCVRENAPICRLCTWDSPEKEEELYYKFLRHLEDVKAHLVGEVSRIDELWWEARIKPPRLKPLPKPAKPVKPKPAKKKPAKPVKEVTIDYHLKRLPEELGDVVLKLREEILKLDDDVEERVNRAFIGYRSGKTRHYFTQVRGLPLKKEIEVRFKSGGPVEDPEKLSKPIPKSFDTPMDRRVRISKPEQIPYVISLLKQAYRNLTG